MTKNMLSFQKIVSFVTVMFFFAAGVALSIMADGWALKCDSMAVFTLLLFFGCVRYYLACERQISKWYRSTLSGWRTVLFDFVVYGTPVLSVMSVLFCLWLSVCTL